MYVNLPILICTDYLSFVASYFFNERHKYNKFILANFKRYSKVIFAY